MDALRSASFTIFVAMLLAAGVTAATASPAIDYVLHCRGCHGPGGEGAPPDVPDMRGSLGVLLRSERGREYLVRVPGAAQAELSDARLAALLNWLVDAYDPEGVPPHFQPYRESEVGRLRQRPLTDAAAARRALFERPTADEPLAME